MLRKLWVAASLAAAFALSFGGVAEAAVFVTSNGTLQVNSTGGSQAATSPPLLDVKRLPTSGGFVFTNQVSGAPFALGSEIRTIAVQRILSMQNGDQAPIDVAGDSLLVITAIRGFIVDTVTGPVARFVEGRSFATAADQPVLADPDTWNFGGTFSEYALAPQMDVIPGPFPQASGISFSKDQINVSAVNTVAGQSAQGQFIFLEDSTAAQNAAPGPDGSGNFGDDFLRDVDDFSPAGLVKGAEGFLSQVDQTIITVQDFFGFGASDLAILNAIAAAAGFSDLGGPGTAWATGLGGAAQTDWNPIIANGDFVAEARGDIHVGHTAVPEPSSMTMALLLAGLGLTANFYRGLRTRRKASEALAV